ncbi:MAG TPA: formylglycine-generating enzyme family protein [Candidatus Obscuribacterales bacterium]
MRARVLIALAILWSMTAAHSTSLGEARCSPGAAAPENMVWIPGGRFTMGLSAARSKGACAGYDRGDDARPLHKVSVDGFWMDRTEVTNEQFERFVRATGYVTVAEQKPARSEFPEAEEADLVPGSVVFAPTRSKVSFHQPYRWWRYVPGANWRHPEGPKSTIESRGNYPVVQVAYEDCIAYAKWAGKRLPTEAEWEYAARGGMEHKLYPWGNELKRDGKWQSNTYQGEFPVEGKDTGEDGHAGIAPVGQFPANRYGLFDMCGNVWEWVSDWYRPDYYATLAAAGRAARNPQGPASSFDPDEPGQKKRVQRGGSFLCTDKYCTRYVLGSRGKGEIRSATNHIGFRCVKSPY